MKGTRDLVISRTPYIAACRIDGAMVTIVRVLHGAQQWPNLLDKAMGLQTFFKSLAGTFSMPQELPRLALGR